MGKTKLAIALFYSAVCFVVIGGCGAAGSTTPTPPPPPIPFQGALNPSFETGMESWNATFATRPEPGARSYVDIFTGTGFMPTNGVRYAYLESSNGFDQHEATIFQDNVDLTSSAILSFDYSFAGTAGAGGGTATLQVLFTSNGTETLWAKTIDATSALPITIKGETIVLPTLPKSGRLTFKLVSLGGRTGATITQTSSKVGIDNIATVRK